ncbi:restriction endonuclease subunit S [bacterium]|nr:restriction endonuclease subunit S [bacterium]
MYPTTLIFSHVKYITNTKLRQLCKTFRDNFYCVLAQLNNEYEYVDDETQKSISRYIVNSNDVIISIVGTIGLTAIIGETLNNANLTENCVKLTNLTQITPEFLLLFLRSKIGQELINKSTVGAVQAKLPIKNIQAIKVPIFSDIEFNNYIKSIFANIANNILVNSRLIQLRDTLLPKLMSGEIDVSNADISTDKLSFIIIFI